jgi:hypothetical protein|tara:strand:+ start:2218 stop:2943 length:726 start_codon:yes stop_codon:yes gene_type:complete
MKVNLNIGMEKNFLAVIHNLSKQDFEKDYLEISENLDEFRISKESRKHIRKIIRDENNLSDFSELKKIYEKNLVFWERYWKEHKDCLLEIAQKFDKLVSEFDFSVMKQVAKFFCSEEINSIEFYLFMGSSTKKGTGNALFPNKGFIFPRNFKKFTDESLNLDLRVLIHEIVHLFQKDIYEQEDTDLMETITNAFAPRGILFEEQKKDEKNLERIEKLVKKAIKENKTFFDVKNELKLLINS